MKLKASLMIVVLLLVSMTIPACAGTTYDVASLSAIYESLPSTADYDSIILPNSLFEDTVTLDWLENAPLIGDGVYCSINFVNDEQYGLKEGMRVHIKGKILHSAFGWMDVEITECEILYNPHVSDIEYTGTLADVSVDEKIYSFLYWDLPTGIALPNDEYWMFSPNATSDIWSNQIGWNDNVKIYGSRKIKPFGGFTDFFQVIDRIELLDKREEVGYVQWSDLEENPQKYDRKIITYYGEITGGQEGVATYTPIIGPHSERVDRTVISHENILTQPLDVTGHDVKIGDKVTIKAVFCYLETNPIVGHSFGGVGIYPVSVTIGQSAPALEAIFAVIGLLTVAYWIRQKKRRS